MKRLMVALMGLSMLVQVNAADVGAGAGAGRCARARSCAVGTVRCAVGTVGCVCMLTAALTACTLVVGPVLNAWKAERTERAWKQLSLQRAAERAAEIKKRAEGEAWVAAVDECLQEDVALQIFSDYIDTLIAKNEEARPFLEDEFHKWHMNNFYGDDLFIEECGYRGSSKNVLGDGTLKIYSKQCSELLDNEARTLNKTYIGLREGRYMDGLTNMRLAEHRSKKMISEERARIQAQNRASEARERRDKNKH